MDMPGQERKLIMKKKTLTLPEIGLIGGTRALLGAGIGLLLADKLSDDQRRAVGWTLIAVGVITTIPIAAELIGKGEEHPSVIRAA